MDTWQTAVCATGILALIYLGGWIVNFCKWRKAKTAKRPVDGTEYITYDSTGSIKERIKQEGHELRVKTWGKEEKG
jgi:hypothetical protein